MLTSAAMPTEASEATHAFARELALSLATGASLQASEAAATCLAVLAGEAMDAMRALAPPPAASAASSARGALTASFREAAAALPLAATRLALRQKEAKQGQGQGEAPPVYVQVRGTGGRRVCGGAFTVGASDACDVQVVGDATVQEVGLIVIPLPGGTVVADAWSNGKAEVVARGRQGREVVPTLGPWCSEAFVVEPDERVVVQIGDKTTVTIEPQAKPAAPSAAPSAATDMDAEPCAAPCAGVPAWRAGSASTGIGLSRASSVREHSPAARSRGTSASRSRSRSRSPMRAA